VANVLNPKQAAFAASLSKLTGLDPHVIGAWTLAEESGTAAQKRAAAGNNNWLNIGMFDSGPGAISKGKQWSSPESAAEMTAAFLKGQKGGADKRIVDILKTAGKDPGSQLKAIYESPWASSHYGGGKSLLGTYKAVAGTDLKLPSGATAQTQPPGSPQAPQDGSSGPLKSQPVQNPGIPGLTVGGLLASAKAHLGETKAQQGQSYIEQAHQEHNNLLMPNLDPLTNAPLPSGAFSSVPVNKLKMSPAATADAKMSPSGKAIVDAAVAFKGTPYSWGGGGIKGPTTGIAQGAKTKGFDCSGLLQYSVYQATGRQIPRVAQAQYAAAKPVSIVNAKPGDAIFFGTPKNVHHVGIYLGDGKFIEAPHTGAVVRISTLADRKDIVGAGRF
jgi:cell wall-associated NlpC family hydrolase